LSIIGLFEVIEVARVAEVGLVSEEHAIVNSVLIAENEFVEEVVVADPEEIVVHIEAGVKHSEGQ
jgi:hypothetical protein